MNFIVNVRFQKKSPVAAASGVQVYDSVFTPVSVPLAVCRTQGKKTHSAAVPFFSLPALAVFHQQAAARLPEFPSPLQIQAGRNACTVPSSFRSCAWLSPVPVPWSSRPLTSPY